MGAHRKLDQSHACRCGVEFRKRVDSRHCVTRRPRVFAAPKRIGLKSHIRLSGVLVKLSLATSSDVSTQLQPVSQLSRQNEIQNQMFHTWRKRSALDIVYYGLWSARQKSL